MHLHEHQQWGVENETSQNAKRFLSEPDKFKEGILSCQRAVKIKNSYASFVVHDVSEINDDKE